MSAQKPVLRVVPSTGAPDVPVDFDTIFNRYGSYVAGVAGRLLGRDDHEVEDVVQDVFWIAARRLGKIHSLEAARPWLVTVTVRIVGRRLRRRRSSATTTTSKPSSRPTTRSASRRPGARSIMSRSPSRRITSTSRSRTPRRTAARRLRPRARSSADVAPASTGIYTCCPKAKVDTLRFKGVDIAAAVSARLAFNSFYLLSQATVAVTQVDLRYRLNGGPWHDRYISTAEAASQDPSKAVPNYWLDTGNFAQVADVPVSELVAGDNTVEFSTVNGPTSYPTVLANIDLVLETKN